MIKYSVIQQDHAILLGYAALTQPSTNNKKCKKRGGWVIVLSMDYMDLHRYIYRSHVRGIYNVSPA